MKILINFLLMISVSFASISLPKKVEISADLDADFANYNLSIKKQPSFEIVKISTGCQSCLSANLVNNSDLNSEYIVINIKSTARPEIFFYRSSVKLDYFYKGEFFKNVIDVEITYPEFVKFSQKTIQFDSSAPSTVKKLFISSPYGEYKILNAYVSNSFVKINTVSKGLIEVTLLEPNIKCSGFIKIETNATSNLQKNRKIYFIVK